MPSDEHARRASHGTRWICRRCEGGFPHPIVSAARWCCPWCGETIGKWAQDYGKREIAKTVPSTMNGGEADV